MRSPTQVEIFSESGEQWTRQWDYIPRRGDLVRGDDDEWHRVTEVQWDEPSGLREDRRQGNRIRARTQMVYLITEKE